MKRLQWACFVLGLAFAGCVTTVPDSSFEREAVDVPDRFLISVEGERREPTGDATCLSPMIDPRDDTEIRIVRSREGIGDYTVPKGRYGVAASEYLRIDCRTGEAIGIVRR